MSAIPFNTSDLSIGEQQRLDEIRLKKQRLLDEIQQLQDELEQVNARIESMDIIMDDDAARLKLLLQAQKRFNQDPKKGLRYMFDTSLLSETAEDVAKFLYECDGLKKQAIGDYLGEKNDFNMEVLRAFVEMHDFQDLALVNALRNFLWHFRLPGEAQKIDRNSDNAYTLSYAVIMLNTSLHNPSVKQRMGMEDFLNAIYNAIKLEAFKFPDDLHERMPLVFQNVDKQGWLIKQGSRHKTWNKRWFVLNDKFLYYFEFSTDKDPKGIIPLEGVRVRISQDNNSDTKGRLHCFEIYSKTTNTIKACKTNSEGKLVEGQHSVYRMSSPSYDEMHNWISAIQRNINRDHYFELLQWRRKRLGAGQSDPSLFRSPN